MSLCASESASRTGKPSSRSIAATALLPLAIPPVRPRRSMRRSPRADGGRNRVAGFAAAKKRGLDGVAHEHGDGHRSNASGNGRERASHVDGVRMHVTDERRALGTEFFETRREITEQAL